MPFLERRRNIVDRRREYRGGRRAADRYRAGIIGVLISLAAVRSAAAGEAGTMRFGTDMDSIKIAASHGANLSYGTFWVGSWTQKFGWEYVQDQLAAARKQGVTPVINWWYWGDDISPACVEQGCQDPRQQVHKDKATWYRMSTKLADLIDKTMGDRGAIVVLETEFNKNGIERYEPFDGYLADQVKIFHRKRNIRVVIGFGNWGRGHWGSFDRAMGEADLLGTQLLQSSIRDAGTYRQAVDTLISGARYLHNTFGKPCLVVDLALSSYPRAKYEAYQEAVMKELFARLNELKTAGVQGLIWRQLSDDEKFDASNYHGIAERFWGLLRADGSLKPAFAPFVNGVRVETARAEETDIRAGTSKAAPRE
jgi:hypothetical protein